jgi:hypothetical protein
MADDEDRAQAEATVRGFHEYFGSPPPLTKGSEYTLPQAIAMVELPREMGGMKIETYAQTFDRVGPLLKEMSDSGKIKDFTHYLSAEPKPEIWVSRNIAAVLAHRGASTSGAPMAHSTDLYTLHKLADDKTGNPWRLSGTFGGHRLMPDKPSPSIQTGPVADIIRSLESMIDLVAAQDLEAIPALLLPGGATTISFGSEPPAVYLWPEYLERARGKDARTNAAGMELLNPEVRRWDDNAFVWAPFQIIAEGSGETAQEGVLVCALMLVNGEWKIMGLVQQVF